MFLVLYGINICFKTLLLTYFVFTRINFMKCANSTKNSEIRVTNGVQFEFPKIQSDIYIQSKLPKYIFI